MATQNYTLGRGKLYFAPFKAGTQIPTGERYFGNTPEFQMTIESQTLDHFSSDRGIREKDDSVPLETNRTGSFKTDNISPENLALFFFGEATKLSVTGSTVTAEALPDVVPGLFYNLGQTEANPVGVRGVSAVVLKKGATTYVLDTDYALNATIGQIEILAGGSIVSGDDLTVDYTIGASVRDHIVSGGTPIEGQLHYVADNPRGANYDWIIPWAKITASGDFGLKGDTWQVISFKVEALRKTGSEAIYIDGRPA